MGDVTTMPCACDMEPVFRCAPDYDDRLHYFLVCLKCGHRTASYPRKQQAVAEWNGLAVLGPCPCCGANVRPEFVRDATLHDRAVCPQCGWQTGRYHSEKSAAFGWNSEEAR